MSPVSDERIAEMLAGLQGVTPGPWYHAKGREEYHLGWEVGAPNAAISVCFKAEVSAHIARCDPDTMRSILTELQQARQKLLAAEKALEPFAAVDVDTRGRYFLQLLICPEGDKSATDWAPKFRAARSTLTTLKAQGITKPDDGREWLPIETAPKDGTVVLAVTVDAQNPGVRMSWLEGDRWMTTGKPEKFVVSGPHRWWPTHWRPLPQPPALATHHQEGRE